MASFPSFPDADPATAAPLRVVLLGLGTVGTGVFQLLRQHPHVFDVRRIVVRTPSRARDLAVPRELLSTNLWDAINEPADLVIELVGGVAPVGDVVQAALLGGRAVVSANKALVAQRWRALSRFTTGVERRLRYSAAVGGEVPVLETVESLAHEVSAVRAVINGTCNFVLDRLEGGASLDEAVREAQAQGFAEADPRGDLSGADAAHKLELIARSAFRVAGPLRFNVSGIEAVSAGDIAKAREAGRRLRLVASCELEGDQVRGRVRLEALSEDDYLAPTSAEQNRVEIVKRDGERVRLQGKGAGRWPTARSVLSDVRAHLRAQLILASTRREHHARHVEALERRSLLEDELAAHQAVVAGE